MSEMKVTELFGSMVFDDATMKEKLPKYMLPDLLVHREALPMTGNGKIDRVQLKKEVMG